jgi:hypothetical protein
LFDAMLVALIYEHETETDPGRPGRVPATETAAVSSDWGHRQPFGTNDPEAIRLTPVSLLNLLL